MVKILEERDNIQRINEENWLLLKKKKKNTLAVTFAVSIFFYSTFKTCEQELDFMSSCPTSAKGLTVK